MLFVMATATKQKHKQKGPHGGTKNKPVAQTETKQPGDKGHMKAKQETKAKGTGKKPTPAVAPVKAKGTGKKKPPPRWSKSQLKRGLRR